MACGSAIADTAAPVDPHSAVCPVGSLVGHRTEPEQKGRRPVLEPSQEVPSFMRSGTTIPRDHGRWNRAVWVRIGYGPAEAVRSAGEALEQLCHRWPAERGPHYVTAKARCVAALEGKERCEAAREAFESACTEACLNDASDSNPLPGQVLTITSREQFHGTRAPQV